MDSQDLAAVLVPVVTAVTGLLGIIWQDWRQRRSTSERRKVAVEDAIRQVAFAEQWWQVRHAIQPGAGPSPESTDALVNCLNDAMATVRAVEPARLSAPRSPIRQLLLLYGFERTSARLLRVVYYLLAAFIAFIGLLGLGNVLAGDGGTTRADLAWQSVFSIVFAVVALAVRAWAVFLEEQPASAPPSTAATH